MTSLNFREMMKEARKKAISPNVVKDEPNEASMGLEKEISKDTALEDDKFVVSRYEYDMEKEIEEFHLRYSKWAVGKIEHVYYIPNFISEEEEADLLSNVRISEWHALEWKEVSI